MKRFIKFNSIGQFSETIKNIQHQARYESFDEETQEPVYNNSRLPVIEVRGSEKIHGTNAAVCYSNPDGMWVQSRKNIITPEKDNAACAFNVITNKNIWLNIINDLAVAHGIDMDENIISVFYEWSGGNIQKKSALTGLDKRSIIFRHFKVSPIEPIIDEQGNEISAKWIETCKYVMDGQDIWLHNEKANIYNIMTFPTVQVEVDFNMPKMAQNKMLDALHLHEKDSPVGNSFGIKNNILEGYVFTFVFQGIVHKFKVKGEEHSSSKVKTLKPVDNEKEQRKIDTAQKVTPAWRLEQMFQEANDTINGGIPVIQNIGPFLKLLNKDILKEDSGIIADANLEPKEVFGYSSKIAKEWYKDQLDELVGL